MNTFINKSKKTKVLSCVAAAAVAFVMTAAPVFAADSSGRNVKDETVYVVTESDGSTSDIIVSDHLKNKASTDTISDTTSLTDIENTKGKEKFTKGDNDTINSLEDLKDKKTANTISSTYAQLAEQYGADVTGVDDLNQTFELLNSGRIDATLNAEVTFYDYTKEHPDANVKIAVLTQDANEVAIPLRKGDETATLREAINTAIDELRASGQLKDLSEKYFGTDISSND